jgi:hypothetical protein
LVDVDEVKNEYEIEVTNILPKNKGYYSAIIVAVAHREFFSLDLSQLRVANSLIGQTDDVLVRDKIVNFPNTDMGINPGNVASGGSIHLTECISGIFEKYSDDDLLKIMQPFPFYFAADRLLLKLCSECNYTYSVFSDLSDGVPPERSNKPILHNIKTHYPSKWKEYRLYLNGNLEINPLL